MSKKIPPQTAKTKTAARPSQNKQGYRCKWRIFLRLCFEEGIQPLDAIKQAKLGGKYPSKTLSRMRGGESLRMKTYKELGRVLRCEPTNLCYLPEEVTPLRDSPAFRFACRIAELIEAGSIPIVDPETLEKTDVVNFVWQMGDPVLDTIRLNYVEQRDAFLILRDYFFRVIERPANRKTPHRHMIGKMEIGITPQEDLIADVDARKTATLMAIETLRRQFGSDDPSHVRRIREGIAIRMEFYRKAIEADQKSWQDYKEDWKDQETVFAILQRSVSTVVEADFNIRKIIFPTLQQDEYFHQFYNRSRRLVEHVMAFHQDDFPTWWNGFRGENTDGLLKFVKSWDKDPDFESPPNWDRMTNSITVALDRTKAAIKRYYPQITPPPSAFVDSD